MATHCSILAWEIPWTEEPGGLQSTGSQRAGHDLATKQQQPVFMHLYGPSHLERADCIIIRHCRDDKVQLPAVGHKRPCSFCFAFC